MEDSTLDIILYEIRENRKHIDEINQCITNLRIRVAIMSFAFGSVSAIVTSLIVRSI